MDFKSIVKNILDVAGIFIIWIIIHYTAAKFYPTFCAESGVFGFIKSIFVAQAPHCIAMRWIIYNGGIVINSMWLAISIWISSKLFNKLLVK